MIPGKYLHHVAAVEQFAEGQELHAELSRPGVALSLSGSAPGLPVRGEVYRDE